MKLFIAGIVLILIASMGVNIVGELYSTDKSILVEQTDESSQEENNSEEQESDDEFGLPEFVFNAMINAEWLSLHQYISFQPGHFDEVVTPPPEFTA